MDVTAQVKRVNDVIDYLAMTYYNIAPLIHNMKMRPSNEIETLCVDSGGRGLFNPSFVSSLDVYQLKFVLMHETYHVLLRHMDRFKEIQDKFEKIPQSIKSKAFNIAADAYINDNLIKSNRFSTVEGCVDFEFIKDNYNISYDNFQSMNTEELYSIIVKKLNSNNDSNGGGGSNNLPDCDSESSLIGDIHNEEKIAEVFGSGGTQSDETRGIIRAADGHFNDHHIVDIVEKNINIDWDTILDKFIYNISGRGDLNRTWRRQNKRYRDIYPYSKGRMKNTVKDILISIDISGSMDENKLASAASVVERLSRKYSVGIKYILFSDIHTQVFEFTSIDELKSNIRKYCGGGTSFKQAINEGNIEQNGIVIISDMEFGTRCEENIVTLNNLGIDYFLIDVRYKCLTNTNKSEYEIAAEGKYIRVG